MRSGYLLPSTFFVQSLFKKILANTKNIFLQVNKRLSVFVNLWRAMIWRRPRRRAWHPSECRRVRRCHASDHGLWSDHPLPSVRSSSAARRYCHHSDVLSWRPHPTRRTATTDVQWRQLLIASHHRTTRTIGPTSRTMGLGAGG